MSHIGSGLDASRPRLAEKAVKSHSIRSRVLSPSITAVGASMPLPRVILADDHTILLEALRKLLEPHCEIVGTVADGRTLLKTAPELKPDVIVADISMPLMNGLEAGARLKEAAQNEAHLLDNEGGPGLSGGSLALRGVRLSIEDFRRQGIDSRHPIGTQGKIVRYTADGEENAEAIQ
jgi:CheY-like chemotaxis protein